MNDNIEKAIDKCTRVSLETITKPQDGYVVLLNRYWTVTQSNEVLLYKNFSPQCNRDRYLQERITQKLYPGCKILFIPIAYLLNDVHTNKFKYGYLGSWHDVDIVEDCELDNDRK